MDTTPLGQELYADLEAGVCVLELFGGIGAVLEGLLRNCVRVCTCLYVDNDTEARLAMTYRLVELHERYPQQLPSTAYAAAFTALPLMPASRWGTCWRQGRHQESDGWWVPGGPARTSPMLAIALALGGGGQVPCPNPGAANSAARANRQAPGLPALRMALCSSALMSAIPLRLPSS